MNNRILIAILSLLGFATACDKEKIDQSAAMYGVPRMNYRVQGTVTDADGNPIPEIKVSGDRDYGVEKEVRTASDGSFDISREDYSWANLLFTDTDGPANGGEFAEKEFLVKFTEEDRTEKGDGGWFWGSYERKDVNVTLDKKTDAEE